MILTNVLLRFNSRLCFSASFMCSRLSRISVANTNGILKSKIHLLNVTRCTSLPLLFPSLYSPCSKHVRMKSPSCRQMGKLAVSIVETSPAVLQPYLKLMRIDRPIGTWLLFWPCGWSLGLAATPGSFPDFYTMFLFGAGAVIMRGAGCVINDMWDRNIDAKVERTRSRPIASGQIRLLDAFMFLTGLLAVGDLILLQFNWQSILLGASSLALVVSYPLSKRYFNWPQLKLAFVFNWGALLGWTAFHGSCNLLICLPLYLGCISWTLIYDTIYALQDKKDDKTLGIKSTAVTLGKDIKKYLFYFSGTMAAGLTAAGILCDQTAPYYLSIVVAMSRLIYQIKYLNTEDPKDCEKKFVSNSNLGFIIMAGIIAGNFLRKDKEERNQKEITS